MAPQLSRHLWNAAIPVASALVALAADRLGAAPARPSHRAADATSLADIGNFIGPIAADSIRGRLDVRVGIDPFGRATGVSQSPVASTEATPTVPLSTVSPNRLTAILIADDRRVAVIDDATVTVGDVLRDGSRVSAIQPDRVFVVEKNGRWRTLTLASRGR